MVYETAGGDAWVKGFAEPGVCFASLTALEPQGCTSFSAYAVVATSVDQIDHAQLQRLVDHHPAWQRLLANAFKLYGQRKEQRERDLLTLSPEQRYVDFLRRFPEVAAVLRQADIASYVRVTPVALSRIKSRIKAAAHDE
jgi:CRP-like cAMP-binding protein